MCLCFSEKDVSKRYGIKCINLCYFFSALFVPSRDAGSWQMKV